MNALFDKYSPVGFRVLQRLLLYVSGLIKYFIVGLATRIYRSDENASRDDMKHSSLPWHWIDRKFLSNIEAR